MGKVELKLEIDERLQERARAAEIQLSLFVERALRAELGPEGVEERSRAWAADNAEAIADHEKRIAEFGVFGEDLRSW